MQRILLTVGQYEISSYSVFTVLALLVVTLGLYFYGQRRGFSRATLGKVIPLLALSSFIGARFLHAAINLGLYQTEPWRLWYIGFSGFSIYGGLLGAVVCAVICARVFRFDLWRLGDTAAPFLGLGIASMRIGCYLNGCCFGHKTDLPWGATFPFMSQVHSHQLASDPSHLFFVSAVHPTQIYELVYALIGALIAFFLIRLKEKGRRIPDGWPVLTFGLVYTIGRLINLQFRVQPPTFDAPWWFYPLLYVFIIILIIFLIWKRIRKISLK